MKSKMVTLTLKPRLLSRIKRLAKAENRTLSNFVETKLSLLCRL